LAGMPLAMGHPNRQVLKLGGAQDRWYALRALFRHRRDVLRGAKFGFLQRTVGMTGVQAALAYVLAHPGVACAVTGTTRLEHLRENLAASGRKLPFETLSRIRSAQAALV
jgi:aryl-alcohol dehydrogenase-like predicted oxidoreductase